MTKKPIVDIWDLPEDMQRQIYRFNNRVYDPEEIKFFKGYVLWKRWNKAGMDARDRALAEAEAAKKSEP